MLIARAVWPRRAATAMTLALVCLGMGSAAGPEETTSTAAPSVPREMAGPGLGGAAIPSPGTQEPVSVSPGSGARASTSLVGARTVSGRDGVIPGVALHAYQRATVIIASSDPECGLDWELLAAIGRIESDHGRHGGSTLDKQGRAVPAIIGIPLNGKKGTMRVKDSDAGVLDRDKRFDRAVGPMQFIPSTWSVVGVDADGDARRDPQDIDDAALAAAVHLCGRSEKLDTDEGLRDAVLRYNHSTAYADQVSALRQEYRAEPSTTSPTSTTTAGTPVAAREAVAHTDGRSPGGASRKSGKPRKPAGEVRTTGDRTKLDRPGIASVHGKRGEKKRVPKIRSKKPDSTVTEVVREDEVPETCPVEPDLECTCDDDVETTEPCACVVDQESTSPEQAEPCECVSGPEPAVPATPDATEPCETSPAALEEQVSSVE